MGEGAIKWGLHPKQYEDLKRLLKLTDKQMAEMYYKTRQMKEVKP